MINSKQLIQQTKPEFLSEDVVRESKWKTMKARSYAKGWNECNSYWIKTLEEVINNKEIKNDNNA